VSRIVGAIRHINQCIEGVALTLALQYGKVLPEDAEIPGSLAEGVCIWTTAMSSPVAFETEVCIGTLWGRVILTSYTFDMLPGAGSIVSKQVGSQARSRCWGTFRYRTPQRKLKTGRCGAVQSTGVSPQ